MEILAFILIAVVGFYLFFYKKKQIKNPAVKKEEIIQEYENSMKELISKYSHDKKLLTQEKTKLLKKINYELSMNLFFDEEEAKQILNNLLKI